MNAIMEHSLASAAASSFLHEGVMPLRAGIGLKPEHFSTILDTRPEVGFFEIHAENYMGAGGPFHHYLTRIRELYPLSIHGVGLSIGGEQPLDQAHLQRLASLLDRYQPELFSEHLAWASHGGTFLNDLLPLPYDDISLQRVCEHIDQVQSQLQRPLLLENPATYLEFTASDRSEPEFLRDILQRTGCGLLLDVNNVYVSCINHGRDPYAYIQALRGVWVGEIHLAGFARDWDAAGDPLLIDSHGSPIAEAVWQLYDFTLQQLGAAPTLIERDQNIPSLATLCAEAQQAEQHLSASLSIPHGLRRMA
jgi:uncharacterized protein